MEKGSQEELVRNNIDQRVGLDFWRALEILGVELHEVGHPLGPWQSSESAVVHWPSPVMQMLERRDGERPEGGRPGRRLL